MIVVDAGVIATAVTDDGPDGDAVRRRLLGEDLAAPELIDLEVVSVLRRLTSARQLTASRAGHALTDLGDLPLHRVGHRQLLGRGWELRDNLTIYDAAYVALAEALDVPLLTADRHLSRAPGSRCAIEVLTVGGPGTDSAE